ncbi:PriCT-2 domain-containing protein [Candidatus Liberibacter asiaticus]
MVATDVDHYVYNGFGILCGIGTHPVYAFDVDVLDEQVVDRFNNEFQSCCGKPISRVGQAPKTLMLFRMQETNLKKQKSEEKIQGHLEFLAYGQQFVAYNIQPKTQRAYTWSIAPHALKVEELPLLTPDEVEYFFEFFDTITTPRDKEKSYRKLSKIWKSHNNRRYTNIEIRAFLSCFGEEFYNGSHDEWIPVVMAIHYETRGSAEGKEIVREWCKLGRTYDEKSFNAKWDSFD